MFFEKMADFIIKRAKLIVVLWIVLLIVAVPFMLQSGSVMQYDMSKMSSSTQMESQKGMEMLNSGEFNSSGSLSAGTIIVVEALDSQASNISESLTSSIEDKLYFWDTNKKLREDYGREYQITVKLMGCFDDKYFEDKDTQMIIYTVSFPTLPDGTKVKASNNIESLRNIVSEAKQNIDGIEGTYVTGNDAISYDTMTGAVSDIMKIDPISILLVLILIGLFFRSVISAATPPIVIGMAYGILLALVFFIGSAMGIFYITTILVLVSMLGAGCDYCIFIISRYREERKECKPHLEALRESIIWAGESIVTSGISVIIGFGSLMLCSFSLVSTMGLVLALGILLALLAALTFIPALLAIIGDRVFWPSKIDTYMEGSKTMNGWYGKCGALGHKYFTKSAKISIKYAKVIVVAVILLTVPLGYVALTSQPSYDMISAMPDGEAKEGVSIISKNIGGGIIMPTTVTMKVDAFVDVTDTTMESGSVVQKDSKITFKAEPYQGYTVTGWFVNGTWTPDTNETLSVTADENTEVEVVYAQSSYDITYSVEGGNGSVSATSNGVKLYNGQSAHYGNTLIFTAAPDTGYHVSKWIVDRNGDTETMHTNDTELSIDACSYNYDVKVIFAKDTDKKYTLKYLVEGGDGTVSVRADGNTVKSGSSVSEGSYITAYAMQSSGYEVEGWYVNGVEQKVTDKSSFSIDSLSQDTEIILKLKKTSVPDYKITFSKEGSGTITATADGKEIKSGDSVKKGSKIVFTAVPEGTNVVEKWTYSYTFLGEKYSYDSYVDKTEHTVSYLGQDTEVKVTFAEKTTLSYKVTYSDPANGKLTVTNDGKQINSGDEFKSGTNLFFSVNPDTGYCVSYWTVNGKNIDSTDETISLNCVHGDQDVSVTLVPVDNVIITYSSNNDTFGKITASNSDTTTMYSERSNASAVYAAMNQFAQTLMKLKTDGKENVAIAIGPVSGDILFDGNHQWVFDTVFEILPSSFKQILGNVTTYDHAVALWKNAVTYEMKQYINYYLTYKLGFVSQPFTETAGGHEYQYVKFMVMTKDEPMSSLSVNTIKQIYSERDSFVSEYSANNGGFVYSGYLSGAAVSNYEVSELVSHDFKFIIVIVIILLIALLFVVMRSYLTPIRAVLTIVMSVIWTLGLTYILFEMILHTPVVWIVPIVLFVVCLGLGMDYDILLTTRIKECVSKGMNNDDAIVAAVQKSGAVITLCGLIMACAFGSMMLSSSPMLKEFGFALGFAIAVDALVIRTYVVPAIMHLMGKWNWKGPSFSLKERRARRKAADGTEQ